MGSSNSIREHALFMGRKTPWGIDCSGLTQVIFRMYGFMLPRDTFQGTKGTVIEFKNKTSGDLAFFENTIEN